jgi:hydroxypyruvate reductase
VDPYPLVTSALEQDFPLRTAANVHLIAAGKGALPMARAALAVLRARVATAIATDVGATDDLGAIELFRGSHPLPDGASVRAGRRALGLAAAARERGEPVLVLLSGGASAMMAIPVDGITLDEKRETIAALLRAGANIRQLNCVRKHLSAIKGGRLAAAAGAMLTLAISDVHDPDDDVATIGSGPTAADPTTFADALRVLDELRCEVPHRVREQLAAGAAGAVEETPKPGDPRLQSSRVHVIADRRTAAAGAAREASRRGYAVRIVEDPTSGEAKDAGRRFAESALAQAPPGRLCVIGSGEPTVRVTGSGRGGRNQEFVLGAVRVLARRPAALIASAGTDGIDGPTDAAGGVATSATLDRLNALGIDVDRVLAGNDAYPALARVDGLVKWGPTGTNVGDVHVVLTMEP